MIARQIPATAVMMNQHIYDNLLKWYRSSRKFTNFYLCWYASSESCNNIDDSQNNPDYQLNSDIIDLEMYSGDDEATHMMTYKTDIDELVDN